MKKKYILLFICGLFILTGCGKRNSNELIMVTEAGFAPYEYYENSEVVGVDVDIAREIAKEMGKTLVIKDIAFDFIIHGLRNMNI